MCVSLGGGTMDYRWMVVRFEPNRETTGTAGLVGHGLTAYFPQIRIQQRPRRGAMRSVLRPMFTGYGFVRTSPSDPLWPRLYNTPGLRGILKMGDVLASITDGQLEAIRMKESELLNFKEPVGPTFKAGDTVRMVDGPFAGQLVNISALDDAGRINILLSLFGRQVKSTVLANQVERV